MPKLIVFLSPQRSGSSITTKLFHRHGMSLGGFELFGVKKNDSWGVLEAMPALTINHTLHRLVYGIEDSDALDYSIVGDILRNRDKLRPTINQFNDDLIGRGIEFIESLIATSPVSGFKHPATCLFWFYWQHVFSHFTDLEVRPIFLLRPPAAIADSYERRVGIPGTRDKMYDLIEIYFRRMSEILTAWTTPTSVVRFTKEFYREDVKKALQSCDLKWNQEFFDEEYDSDLPSNIDTIVDHPCRKSYEHLLTFARPDG